MIRTPIDTCRKRASSPGRTAGTSGVTRVLVTTLFITLTTAACATSPDEPSSTESTTSESADAADTTYGDDPMGTARRWAADLSENAGDHAPEVARGWSEAVVLRLYRAGDGDFRAVVAESDDQNADAVVLTITRGGGMGNDWSVADVRPTDATRGWPTN
jgi:hypothetical protein